MRITFVVRQRSMPGTALQNAARYDAEFLARQGHDVRIVEVHEGAEAANLSQLLKKVGWPKKV